MATASFASILLSAGNAMAACTTSQGSPLTGIVGGESVTCTGATNAVTINGGGGNNVVTVATGASLTNSTIAINSGFSNNVFRAGSTTGGATLNNVSLSIGSDGVFEFIGGTATGIAIQNANRIDIRNGASVSAQNGQILMATPASLVSLFNLRSGAALATSGVANGQSLLTGSAGADVFVLNGSITTASDGRVMSGGAGNDDIEVGSGVTFAGSASGYVFDGGLEDDTLRLSATSGSYNRTLTAQNFERLVLNATTAGVSTANINGSFFDISVNGTGEVRLTNAASLAGGGFFLANTGSIVGLDTGGGNLAIDKVLVGDGRINVMGTGVTTFNTSSLNFFQGVLGLQAGTTVIGVTNAVGSATIQNSAALQFDAVTIANIINGTGTVTKTGSGIGILSGSNSFTGATTVTGGTLRITRDNAAGVGTITANAGTFFDLNFASNVSNSYTRVLNGAGTLTKSGTGLIDVQNTQLHTGGTIINDGTLRTDAISRLGTGPIVVNAAGRFALNNSSNINQTASFLSGAGMFEKLGAGTLTLNAANTFTGGSVLTSGVVRLVNNQGLGTGTIDVSGAATLEINTGLIANNLIGTGQVRKVSAGLVDLTGTNSFTGGLFIDAGTVRVNNSGALGAGFVQVNLGGNLNFDNAADITAGANFGGFGAVTKTGAGRLTLLGDNSAHTGQFSINQGVLEIGSALAAGGSSYVIGAGSTLNLNYPADGVFANNLSGAGSVLKTGAGIVDLTGTNTHSGGNVIDQGGIRVFDLAQLGTGLTTANAGTSLYFNYGGAAPLLLTTPFMSGAGSFVKEGSGDLIIDTANTWTGGTRIVQGRVGINDGMALGTGAVQVDANGIFNFGQFTFANDITGTGIVRKTASGVGSLTGNNSGFSGEVQINDGRLVVTSGNALGTGQVNIGGGAELLVDNATDITLSTGIYGNGSFIKDGAGRLILAGANSISGTLLVNGGELEVASGSNIGGAAIDLAGAGTALVLNRPSGGTTFSNVISGIGSVLKLGSGTVSLTGNNSYSGGTTIAAGALRVSNLAALGTGAVAVQSGAFLDFDVATAATWNAAISGAGSLRKSGLGDLTLVSNALSGGLDVQEGRVLVSTAAALGSGPVTTANQTALVFTNANQQLLNSQISGGGQLVMDGTGQLVISNVNGFTGGTVINSGRVTLNDGAGAGSGLITVNAMGELGIGNISLANAITGAGRIVKTASGLANLTGSNTGFSGVLAIDGGSVQIANASALGTGSVAINGSANRLIVNTPNAVTLANVISGTGGVNVTGGGVVTLTGTNTYSGGTDIAAGILRATNVAALGTGPVAVQSGALLDLDLATAATWNAVLSGAGGLRKSGLGDLTLVTNSLSGGLDVQQGRVLVSTTAALGSGQVTTANQTALVFTNTTAQTMNNAISGAGQLIMNGAGQLVISNANTFTGGSAINAGRVTLNDGAGLGTGLITVNAPGELGIGNVTVANAITGAGRIVKTASGNASLTGANTGFSGVLAIDAGSVQIGAANALGTGSVALNGSSNRLIVSTPNAVTLANVIGGTGGVEVAGGGFVTLSGANSYSGGSFVTSGRLHAASNSSVGTGTINLTSNGQFSFDAGNQANTITGAGLVVKLGTGSGSLTGTNTHSGGTLISAGTLTAASMAGFGSGAVQVNATGTLTMTNTGTLAFANALSGAGALRMAGTGRLDFANAFSIRNLFVDTGRVRLNAAATTDATVASAGTLDGTGRIIGSLTSSGIVAPGNSIGTLTVQGNYTQNASGVLEVEFDGSGNIDLLDVTGNATLNGGTIRFVSVGGAEGNGGTFLRTGGTVTGTFATIETVGAQLPLSVIYSSNTATMAPSVLTARPSTFNAQTLAAADGVFGFAGAVSEGVSMLGEGRGVWANGFASSGERSASGSTLGYDHNGSGVATGFNLPVNASVSLGVAVGWSTTEIDLASGGGGGTQDALLGSAYVRYSTDAITVLAGVATGVVDQSTVRNVSFNGFSGSVEGSGDADMTALFFDGRINLGAGSGWDVDGVGRVTFVTMSQDKYLESGTSPLRLEVAARDAETAEVRLGLEASRLLIDADQGGEETGAGTRLTLAAGVASTNVQDNRVIPVRFQVSNAGINLQGDTRDETAPYLRAGIVHTTGEAARFSLGYEGQFGDNPDHALRAGVALRF